MRRIPQLVLLTASLAMSPMSAKAQGYTLHPDTAAAVMAALKYAQHDLLKSEKHHVVNRTRTDRASAWSDGQARAFGQWLSPMEGGKGAGLCDSSAHECVIDAGNEIVSISAPMPRGDSVVVEIQVERATNGARQPVALRGHQYVLVCKGGHWVVVGSYLSSVT